MKSLITLAACLTMMAALLHAQNPIFVTPTGSGTGASWADACNLETAVINAVSGDQIWVRKGTYKPSEMLVVPDSVKIYGGFAGTETMLSQRLIATNPVIIDGQHQIGSIFRLGRAAELHGLTIKNGNANGNSQGNSHKSGGGVWADENCVIANCIITNNTAVLHGGGVYAKGKVKIINSTVEDNVANTGGNDLFGNCLMLGGEQQSGTGSGVDITGCNPHIPILGEVIFKSDQITSISANGIEQEWSDYVMAEGCNKASYYGGISGSYYSDCRANSPRETYGDLFSWCVVARFAHVLCPAPWRVPTVEDFFDLDKAMGGYGDGSGPSISTPGADSYGTYYHNNTVLYNYLNTWNYGFYSGFCYATGTLDLQGTITHFWAQSQHSSERGFRSEFYSGEGGRIRPQANHEKNYGFSLRCVK